MAKISTDNIYAFVRDPKVDCIAIEAGSTIRYGRYDSVQHPKCYDAFDRTFGADWKWVLGAALIAHRNNTKPTGNMDLCQCMMVPPYPIPLEFDPFVIPTVLRFKKIIVAVVIKPPTNIEGFMVDPCVNVEDGKPVPGYLCATREEDIRIASLRLNEFAKDAELKNIIVAPLCQTDFYFQPRETAKIMSEYLEDNFTIALGGF